MKNKSLNTFAGKMAKQQFVNVKLISQIKGGNSEPPPIEDGLGSGTPCAICCDYLCDCS